MKIEAFKHDGWQIGVDIQKPLDEYAQDFLAIFNNVKSNEELISLTTSYDNRVYVTCVDEAREDTIKWLEQFGEIVFTEKVLLIDAGYLDYDDSKYYDVVVHD